MSRRTNGLIPRDPIDVVVSGCDAEGVRSVSRLLVAALASLTPLGPSVGHPASAAPSPYPVEYTGRFAVSIVGDGAFGDQRAAASHYNDDNATLGVVSSRRTIDLRLEGGDRPGGAKANLSFTAPEDGGPLTIGSYVGATNTSLDPSRPQINFGYYSEGWETVGSFDILDMHVAEGRIDRIRLTYVVYLDGDARPVSGAVSIGYGNHRVQASPSAVRWPDTTYVGHTSTPARIDLRRLVPEHVRLSGHALLGPDRDEFTADVYTRLLVPTGDGVPLAVTFEPTRAGPAHAWLRLNLREHGAPSHIVVPLDAVAQGGSTRWDLESDPGDEVGGGGVFHLTDTTRLRFEGSRKGFNVWYPRSPSMFRVWVEPPAGQRLHVGRYRDIAVRPADFQPRFDVTSDVGCESVTGHFDIDDIAYSKTEQALTRLDLSFVQHCDGETPAIRGRIRLHVADDQHAPPPPVSVTAHRDGDRIDVAWTLPPASDLAGVSIRSYTGVRTFPVGPTFGVFRAAGLRSSTSFFAPADQPVSLSLFAYDTSGNASKPATIVVRSDAAR